MARTIFLVVGAAAILTGCSAKGSGSDDAALNLHHTMASVLSVEAQHLWDVTNNALGDSGQIDPSLMTDEQWKNAETASENLRKTAIAIAEAKTIVVSSPGQKISNEGEPGAAGGIEVQHFIDADRETFSALASSLAQSGTDGAKAARERNPAELARVSNELDGVCEACHKKFWFPKSTTQ